MFSILAGVTSLIQQKQLIEAKIDMLRPERCSCCGRLRPRRHGAYPRESDRLNPSSHSLNPVLIQRYYCPACQKTMSVLPECISPRRWYPWEIQQVVLALFLLGKSVCKIALEVLPSRHTISRWLKHFKAQYHLHKDTLCIHFHEAIRASEVINFWKSCLEHMTLASAMRLCHVAGVVIP